MNSEITKNMNSHNKLSIYACHDSEAIRFKKIEEDIRTPFFRDIDRIIYSLSYIRYADKTQVFSNSTNDMISRRMTHVQMVSKIARTIGRALGLNEDLIEAASLGHDLGHTPFGHVGESILNDLSIKYGEGFFNHNVQSVRTLMEIENNGKGNNITVQVLDAIFCHNGEIIEGKYNPVEKTKEEFLREYSLSYKDKSILKSVKPMTLEGCVVRISDVVAYLGKDIEDAIRLGKINEFSIPQTIVETLGSRNSDIVNTIVMDIIENSIGKDYIKVSDKIFEALQRLIGFNNKEIYMNANTKEEIFALKTEFTELFDLYYNQITNKNVEEDIYKSFINKMDERYVNTTTPARKIIDYMAGMTDEYFKSQYNKYFVNVKQKKIEKSL